MCRPLQILNSVVGFVSIDVIHLFVVIWIIDPRLGNHSVNELRISAVASADHLVAAVVVVRL